MDLTLFGKRMFFARTNDHHSSDPENAHGFPNQNSHNARHSNRPLVSRARQKRRPIGAPDIWGRIRASKSRSKSKRKSEEATAATND